MYGAFLVKQWGNFMFILYSQYSELPVLSSIPGLQVNEKNICRKLGVLLCTK